MSAKEKRQKRAVQVPLDAIARRLERAVDLKPGRLRLSLQPVSATEVQYQLFANPNITDPELIARVNTVLAEELAKFAKANGTTVDTVGTVPPKPSELVEVKAHNEVTIEAISEADAAPLAAQLPLGR